MEALLHNMTEDFDVSELLRDRGVTAYGNVFSKGVRRRIARSKRSGADQFWSDISNDGRLVRVWELSESRASDTLCPDIVEMLYLARNMAIHGTLDPAIKQHNEIARTALQVLDNIVERLVS